MTAPNLIRLTDAVGKTTPVNLGTSETVIVANTANSNKAHKINALFIANVNGSAIANVTVSFKRGSTSYPITSTVDVQADSSLVVIGKDTCIYLEEGDSLVATASQAGYLTAVVSYEILG